MWNNIIIFHKNISEVIILLLYTAWICTIFKQHIKRNDINFFEVNLLRLTFTLKYISIFFILWVFRSITKILTLIILLIIVSLNLLFYISYLHCHKNKVLPFYTFSASGISYLKMLTRSSEWIFNPMRYTGKKYF